MTPPRHASWYPFMAILPAGNENNHATTDAKDAIFYVIKHVFLFFALNRSFLGDLEYLCQNFRALEPMKTKEKVVIYVILGILVFGMFNLYNQGVPYDNNVAGFILAGFSVLVTVLVGWQIYSFIKVKDDVADARKEIRNEFEERIKAVEDKNNKLDHESSHIKEDIVSNHRRSEYLLLGEHHYNIACRLFDDDAPELAYEEYLKSFKHLLTSRISMTESLVSDCLEELDICMESIENRVNHKGFNSQSSFAKSLRYYRDKYSKLYSEIEHEVNQISEIEKSIKDRIAQIQKNYIVFMHKLNKALRT